MTTKQPAAQAKSNARPPAPVAAPIEHVGEFTSRAIRELEAVEAAGPTPPGNAEQRATLRERRRELLQIDEVQKVLDLIRSAADAERERIYADYIAARNRDDVEGRLQLLALRVEVLRRGELRRLAAALQNFNWDTGEVLCK